MQSKTNKRFLADFDSWVLEALDLGFKCFGDGDQTPFVLAMDEDGQRHLIDVVSTSGVIDASVVALARRTVRQMFPNALVYAIVSDGYLTVDDSKYDAVLVEAAAPGDARATIFAQLYKQTARSKKLRKVGTPMAVKKTTQLLKKTPKSRRSKKRK